MLRLLCFTFLTSCLVSTIALAGELIKGRVETNLRMGQERSIFMTEFWIPFLQSKELDTVLYGSLRMMGDNENNREGNLGLGYRRVIAGGSFKGIAGVHGWLDRRVTERGSKFYQVTTGVEWLGESVDVRLNGYIPLSDKREITVPNANPRGPELAGTGILVDTNGTVLEEPQGGFDLEFGLELGQYFDFIRNNIDRFHIYTGGYYFDGANTENVAGWRTRFTADVTENIQIGARFQHDDERGSQGFLEATFSFPFGHKKSYRSEGIRARLDESPERDIDIVTNETVTDSGDRVQVLNTTTGTAQEVLHVDNTAAGGGNGSAESPFNTLADAQAAASAYTIIYVNRGDGTDTNQDQGITLNQTGQQLIGSGTNFVYDSGRFTTANGSPPLGSLLLAPATTAPVIGNVNANQDGVTISANNVTVAGLTVDNSNTGRDGIVVRADGAAASAQNVTIQNVITQNNRHGIYIHGTNDGYVSAMVQNTVTTSNSQHGIVVYDDTDSTFAVDLGGGSMGSVGNNVLTGNTLEDLAVEYDGRVLFAQNNWWGQASGPDTDDPTVGIDPQIYYGAPINDGLVGHWTFDSEWTTNTTAYDRSGQNNDGTLEGGLSLADQVTGQNRQALDFDGVDDFVEISQDNSLNLTTNFTFYAQVLPDNASTHYIISHNNLGHDPSGGYEFRQSGTAILLNSNNISNVSSAATVPTGAWSGIAVTNNSGTGISFYEDGAFLITQSPSPVFNPVAQDVLIGRRGFNNAQIMEGQLDDIRIYNTSLNASEISELHCMDTSSSVSTSGFLSSSP